MSNTPKAKRIEHITRTGEVKYLYCLYHEGAIYNRKSGRCYHAAAVIEWPPRKDGSQTEPTVVYSSSPLFTAQQALSRETRACHFSSNGLPPQCAAGRDAQRRNLAKYQARCKVTIYHFERV